MAKIALNLFAIFLALAPCAHGQTISPQWNWPVSSDFGPRLVPAYDFHEGVDFNPLQGDADLGTPIPNLEGGLVFNVVDNLTFYEVKVQGRNTGHMWFYGHIFRNNDLDIPEYGSTTRRWELRRDVQLVSPIEGEPDVFQNVIIRWEGDYALSVITKIGGHGRQIMIGGNCIGDTTIEHNCIEAIDSCITNVLYYGLEVHYAPFWQPAAIGTTTYAGGRFVPKWIPAC